MPPFGGIQPIELALLFGNYPPVTRSVSPTAADLLPDAPIEDRIVALRCDGMSIAGIAKRLRVPHAEVHAVLADWAAGYFGADRRATMLAITTARLERIFSAHREKAYAGDIQSTNACLKCCAHLASMHGLYMPSVGLVNHNSVTVVDARPQTPIDKLETALARLLGDQRKAEAQTIEADAVPAEAPTAGH